MSQRDLTCHRMASGACNDSQLVKLDENSLSKAEKRTAYTVDRLIEVSCSPSEPAIDPRTCS